MSREKGSEIVRSNIDVKIVCQLWGISAGRCEICNQLLYIDPHYGFIGNYAEKAHIHGVGKNGPRHNDEMTKDEINNIDNLMLLCPQHHKMIDDDPEAYKDGLLIQLKADHESRIKTLCDISEEQETRIVSYITPINNYAPEHKYNLFLQAVVANKKYPKQTSIIDLSTSRSSFEPTKQYYDARVSELEKAFLQKQTALTEGESISLFAFALQPLLVKLGTLINDQYNVTAYQCHRYGHKWMWKDQDSGVHFIVRTSASKVAERVALVVDLSAPVNDERISCVLGNDVPIWRITQGDHNRDFVTTPSVQERFIKTFRNVMEQVKTKIPFCQEICLFPVMPTSLNVRLGMDYMKKADLPLKIYDQDRENGGFFETITIGGLTNVY